MTAEACFGHIRAVLPACDMEDYPQELFMSFAEHGAMLRREMPWCAELSEEMFLSWVLCPRVNNEVLSDCRGLFYEQLAPRVKGLGLTEAILEVNRWCAENVTYRSTDERTASALAIYNSGCGRCGEESVFAVNALRSVGIAARQVYSPWWSHCDDNHAWVEAFDGEGWRFLGACEPEPRLDMGWFTPAAGRAMLCHAKCFVGEGSGWERLLPGEDKRDADRREGVAYISVTQRYAKVRPFTVLVTDAKGNGLPGATVEYYVLNEGLLRRIAQRVTDSSGRAVMDLGLGSLWLVARLGDMAAEMLVNTADSDHAGISLPQGLGSPESFDFIPPEDSGIKGGGSTGKERVQRQETRARAKGLREEKHPGGGSVPDKPELWPWQRFAPGEVPELWQDGRSHTGSPERGTLTLHKGSGKGALGLMRWEEGWKAVSQPEFGRETELPAGRYRLITSSRLPNGTQLARSADFTLRAGEALELEAGFRKGTPDQLLQRLPLPDLGFTWEGLALLCWIEPGAEPTEHLLNELKAAGRLGCRVHFIGRGLDKPDGLPEGAVLHGWDDYVAETVARRVFLEPDNLPLVVLADGEGFGRFASAGYNVGSVELAAELCGIIENGR